MSETAKHTPGPWTAKWSKYREGCFIVQTCHPSNRILARFDGDGAGPDAEEIASAHLIAAAPDMLIALRECVKQINATIEDGISTDYRMWRDDINAVIAKATAA